MKYQQYGDDCIWSSPYLLLALILGQDILDIYLLSMLADAICCPNKVSKRHGPYKICNSYTKSIYDPAVLRFLLGQQPLYLQELFFSHIFLFRQHVSSATLYSKNVSGM